VVLRAGEGGDAAHAESLRARVAEHIGGLARPEEVVFVRSLPKTRSGKIMRRVVRAVAEDRTDLGDISTLEDEASVDEVLRAFQEFRAQVLGGSR